MFEFHEFEFHDIWAGWKPVRIEPFKTTRQGTRVVLYRLPQTSCNSTFTTEEAAAQWLQQASVRYPQYRRAQKERNQ